MTKRDQLLSDLMKEAQNGVATSYETLLSEVYVFLAAYLSSKVYNKSHLDDIIQEIILAVHNSRHTFDCTKSFMSWLLAITHYKVSDHLRSQYKHKTDDLEDTILNDNSDTLAALIQSQDIQLLNQAIDELDQKPQQIVKLLKIEGFRISEVAVKLNLSESNVKVIAHRAYQGLALKLRGKL